MRKRLTQCDERSGKKRIFLLLGVLLLLGIVGVLVASCGGSSSGTTTSTAGTGTTASTPTTTGTTSSGATTSTGGASGGAQVTLQNIQINPTSVTIKVGDTVTWTNKDSVTHHLVGDKGEFDSGDMAPGTTFSFTFNTAGTIAYHCSIHPSMTGTIIVQ